jgi:hypothetical protein
MPTTGVRRDPSTDPDNLENALKNPDNLKIPDAFETLEIGTLQFEIFNEAELAGSKDVGNPSQGATALTTTANNASTTPATIIETEEESTHPTKDMENGLITGRTRRAIYKAKLPKRYFRKKWESRKPP